MKVLHIDLPSGISGDMTLAAFLDVGVPESVLREGLSRFGLDGYELIVESGEKGGISGTHVQVIMTGVTDPHHVEQYHKHHEHGFHEHGDPLCEPHEHEHHEHGNLLLEPQGHQYHEPFVSGNQVTGDMHIHRNWKDIRAMITGSTLYAGEKTLAVRIFQRIADAEGKIHGKPADEVGFHEVGAVDSIVDIVGAAICFHWLMPERVTASAVNTGSGFVRCMHGLLPVPAPATAAILSVAHVPMYAKGSPGERTTPTGAAILAEIVQSFGQMQPMTVSSIGYGLGTKDFDSPNILRMMVGETAMDMEAGEPNHSVSGETDEIIVLEANLDDMTGEAAGYLMGKLLNAGAKDVFYTPVFMKKNRPGMLLTVLAAPGLVSGLECLIFQESSTIGIRRIPAVRTVMNRTHVTVFVRDHPVLVKVCKWKDIVKAAPEYESVREVSELTGLPFRTAYRMAESAYALYSGETP